MSNFTCPTCGFTNIDCGKDGYKTTREIELEKKLDITVKALRIYANLRYDGTVTGYEKIAQQALKEIVMAYLEELLPEFRKGVKITNRSRDKSFFVQMRKDNGIVNSYGEHYSFDFFNFINDDWELYKYPEPDWQYIIDHKCICWFWNNHHSADDEEICFLHCVDERIEKKFNTLYKYCRPVLRDEVTFYEDKKDY